MLTLWFRDRDPAELHRSTRALRCRLPLPASIARARALALTCARRCAPTRSARATRCARPSARRRRRRRRQPSPTRLPRARPQPRAWQPACPRAHSLGAAALARRPSRGRRRAARESGGGSPRGKRRAEPEVRSNRRPRPDGGRRQPPPWSCGPARAAARPAQKNIMSQYL